VKELGLLLAEKLGLMLGKEFVKDTLMAVIE